jgi:hypothetical protein
LIQVKLNEPEKLKVLAAVKVIKTPTISVAQIAKATGINNGRCRFVVESLLDDGRLVKIPVKNYNERYKRYRYEVPK